MGELKHQYFFPNVLANVMAKIDMRTQLEASLMSMTLIIIGLCVTTFYIIAYIAFPLWYKIVVVINCLAGILFLSSFLVTTFNQYRSYLEAVEFQKELKKQNEN